MASKRDKIKLESTAGTGHYYTTSKNKRTMPEKMEMLNSIRSCASTWSIRKRRSNKKTRGSGFFYVWRLALGVEGNGGEYLQSGVTPNAQR